MNLVRIMLLYSTIASEILVLFIYICGFPLVLFYVYRNVDQHNSYFVYSYSYIIYIYIYIYINYIL